jgi:hypothetical protein
MNLLNFILIKIMMCGGFGQVKTADDTTVELVNGVKSNVENLLGQNFNVWEPVHFRTQVVNGTNYIVKVKTDNDYVHVKIHKPLPHNGTNPHLIDASSGHNLEAAI